MSTRKLIRALQSLFEQIGKLARTLTQGTMKHIVSWLLRGLLLVGRRSPAANAGFVLPTIVLLLLVVTLTVGSISFRTFTRTADASYDKQQRVIYNAATPAIDRAKAKLEYLFDPDRDPRLPNGVPPEQTLVSMMLNDGRDERNAGNFPSHEPNDYDVYTFPGETRLDLNGDGRGDNAWYYEADLNGNGTTSDDADGYVSYSILFQTEGDDAMRDTTNTGVSRRAENLQVRHGPLSINSRSNSACAVGGNSDGSGGQTGWFVDENDRSLLKKNFQVNAFVVPKDPNGTVSTLEFHQDREIRQGNKWGAWFRNDLEIFPGPDFKWNGAMHTEGNLIVGQPDASNKEGFKSYLISARASCLFDDIRNSEVTVTEISADPEKGVPAFQGQVISALIRENAYDPDNTVFHLLDEQRRQEIFGEKSDPPGEITNINEGRDSVDGQFNPADFALDPVELQTTGNSKARSVENPQSTDAWKNRSELEQKRIYNQKEEPPYVDDSYRADNRYGPKPIIGGQPLPAGTPIGAEIVGRPEYTEDDPPLSAENNFGFDGYWERRARKQGLRLIVGQRLELGNAFGWQNADEPMRPWRGANTANAGRENEARQRRTLRDNLAAVQATAVYHAASGDPDRPVACLATTVHPGTGYTLERSSTFEDLSYDLSSSGGRSAYLADPGLFPTGSIISDFFKGRGTNGWEYDVHPQASFTDPNSVLMRALRNLATYAGDPKGGAPSFTPEPDQFVHPLPSMAMWGDFSMLRRVLEEMDRVGYDNLSPADKSTIHTAACTIGMLAYNIHYLYEYTPPATELDRLKPYLRALWDPTLTLSGGLTNPAQLVPPILALPNSTTLLTPERVIAALERWRDRFPAGSTQRDTLNRVVNMAQLLATKEQVWRDGRFGYDVGPDVNYNCTTWIQTANTSGLNNEPLASLCSNRPYYPILLALFSNYDTNNLPGYEDIPELQLRTRDTEDSNDTSTWNYIQTVNAGSTYKVIDRRRPDVMNLLVLRPRPLNQWVLPYENAAAASPNTPNSNRDVFIRQCSTVCSDGSSPGQRLRVAFKDSAMFNGRELMSVRTLDMNLNFMRNRNTTGMADPSDFWLPKRGIIYAFREDAVSESSIYRPQNGNWLACSTDAAITTAGCRMNTSVSARRSVDPPLNRDNLISPKPVDYYPDPDRRPYGFRLRNGAELGRSGDEGRGLTLVSDNPVYIQGDFNLHQTGNGKRLEEFTELLNDDFSNFYTRTGNDTAFARAASDRWRPAEILADAVTILSNNFCDGSVEDSFLTAGVQVGATVPAAIAAKYGCEGNNRITSYLDQNRPSQPDSPDARQNRWLREDREESRFLREDSPSLVSPDGGRVPVLIDRQGNPVKITGVSYDRAYYDMSANRSLVEALDDTRVNSTIVSGIVPSRPNQTYGGLHNFPRFLENWNSKDLYISGSFIQLSFSNYATAPFDQDAFEAGSTPRQGGGDAGEFFRYYRPPNRRWGYDVGLLIAPAGPIAQRFVSTPSVRNEFYEEPPADDFYIRKLCLAAEREVGADINCPPANPSP